MYLLWPFSFIDVFSMTVSSSDNMEVCALDKGGALVMGRNDGQEDVDGTRHSRFVAVGIAKPMAECDSTCCCNYPSYSLKIS